MRALGLRAEPTMLHWALVEGDAEQPVLVRHDKAKPPVHVDEAEALSWYRERLTYLIQNLEVDVVGLRFAEAFGRKGGVEPAQRRSRIEGVLLQGAHACEKRVITGALNSIAAALGTKKSKAQLSSGELRGLDLSALQPNRREAVFVAVAALAACAIDR